MTCGRKIDKKAPFNKNGILPKILVVADLDQIKKLITKFDNFFVMVRGCTKNTA